MRTSIKGLTGLVLLAVTASSLAATLPAGRENDYIDAAELDRDGNTLRDPNGVKYVAMLGVIDNRRGATDLTGIRFKPTWTGDNPVNVFGYADLNPWADRGPEMVQWIGGTKYVCGHVLYADLTWAPHVEADPTPEDNSNDDNIYYEGVVPAGIYWLHGLMVRGEDAKLFHSPAEAEIEADVGNYWLYDTDPRPIPEPATAMLLLGGLVFLGRPRWRSARP